MHNANNIETVQIVFFSGTGGVKRIADAFKKEVIIRGIKASQNNLDSSLNNKSEGWPDEGDIHADLIILLFPLHAFDAPDPVYEWIKHAYVDSKKVAVISVSGGGEAWPNTGCRNDCCKALEQKGAIVVYDRMMCMPSNWVFPVSDHIAMWLISVIPQKVSRILDDLLDDKIRRTKFRKGFLRSYITRLEKKEAKIFAQKLIIDGTCTGCGICSMHCPVDNIDMKDQRPSFNDRCVMCFRCIYACPSRAMKSNSFMVLKKGYNLSEVEKHMRGVELEPVEKCCRGLFWRAVRNYLLDKDGY